MDPGYSPENCRLIEENARSLSIPITIFESDMMPKLHSTNFEGMELIRSLKQINPLVEKNIFRSVENVNLDTVIAYKRKGKKHSFLDEYDDGAVKMLSNSEI